MKKIAKLLHVNLCWHLAPRSVVTTALMCLVVVTNGFVPANAQNVIVLEKSNPLAPQAIGKLLFPAADASNPGSSENEDIPQALRDRAKGNRGIHKDADFSTAGQSSDLSDSRAALPAPHDAPKQTQGSSLAVPINFAFNSNQIDAAAKPALDSIGQALSMPEYKARRLLIEGHTDAVGRAGYNLDLSLRRASAAAQYLHDRYGIDYDRLEVAGRGSSDPLPGYGANDAVQRRVQFKPL